MIASITHLHRVCEHKLKHLPDERKSCAYFGRQATAKRP
ncbi:putative predicted protein [Rhizobium favelukesii]|uniref:Uncharacterized protein n=1 Tax=Rhizobium favelukesii TaxID=348824 RepID=W6RB45_9HYPH|nr:putative predicted protein [Rhizobium favelukesii]